MHIRRGRYIGVAPVPGGLTNVCLVTPWVRGARPGSDADSCAIRDSTARLAEALESDPALRDRFAAARPCRAAGRPRPAGGRRRAAPDRRPAAGRRRRRLHRSDDRRRPALRCPRRRAGRAGGSRGARATAGPGARERSQRSDAQEFAGKWRFNRALRTLVASPVAVAGAAATARRRSRAGPRARDTCRRLRAGRIVSTDHAGDRDRAGVPADARRGTPRRRQRAHSARARRNRAARRCLPGDAVRVSRGVSRDDCRRRMARPTPGSWKPEPRSSSSRRRSSGGPSSRSVRPGRSA